MTKWIPLAVILAIAGGALGAASTPAPIIGTVDMAKVRAQYKAYQDANTKFQDYANSEMRAVQKYSVAWALDDKDRDRLLKLMDITARTGPQNDELQGLLKQHNDLQARYRELQSKETRTPAEATEFAGLDTLYKRRQQDLDKAQDDADARIKAKQKDMVDPLDKRIQEVAGQLAAEKTLTAILVQEVVVFGAVDITDDFITRLNANAAPPAAPK